MAFIPVVNCLQVEVISNFQGQVVENVLHYTKASPWTTASATEVAEAIIDAIDNGLQALVGNQVSYNSIRLTDLANQNGFSFEFQTGLPLVGTASGDMLPNNCALALKKNTGLRGRSFRGRLYHYGFVESQVALNTVAPATVSSLLSFYNFLLGIAITGDEAILCVVSRFTNGTPRVTGTATPVVGFTTDGIIDSQRRRLPGRGA